jgi:carbon monoxide dehydrogenase subunit G
MRLQNVLTIRAPLESVRSAIVDLREVAAHIPGAALSHRRNDGVVRGTFRGDDDPRAVPYRFAASVRDVDGDRGIVNVVVRARHADGPGLAHLTIRNELSSAEGGASTRAAIVVDADVLPVPGRTGQDEVVRAVAERVMAELERRLERTLRGPELATTGGAVVEPGNLSPRTTWSTAPGPRPAVALAAAVVAAGLAFLAWRRRATGTSRDAR